MKIKQSRIILEFLKSGSKFDLNQIKPDLLIIDQFS